MTTSDHQRRIAINRSMHLYPSAWPKPPQYSKRELQEMLREAVKNTAKKKEAEE